MGMKVRYSRVGRGGRCEVWRCLTVFEEVENWRDLGGRGGVSLFPDTFRVD